MKKIIKFTDAQKRYLDEHYHNTPMQQMMDETGLTHKQIEGYAYYHHLKRDADFHCARSDGLTYQQIDYLIDHYNDMTNVELAQHLGCDVGKIGRAARQRGLKKTGVCANFRSMTPQNRQYILDNYATMRTAEIAKHTGVSPSSIRSYAYAHGIRRDTEQCPTMCATDGLTSEQKQYIIQHYATMSNTDIAGQLDITEEQIHSYASNRKLKKEIAVKANKPHYLDQCLEARRDNAYNVNDHLGTQSEPRLSADDLFISKYGKYHCNARYFSVIDNEWKAYWLGFLYADGSVQDQGKLHCLYLGLSTLDKSHIQRFLDSVQSDTFIRDYPTNFDGCVASKTTVANQQMVRDLIALGCTPRKSLTLEFPTLDMVPTHLVRHFIRGYFDGDGCIYVNLERRDIKWSLLGTEAFLTQVQKIFVEQLNIRPTSLLSKQGTAVQTLEYGNIYSIHQIYKYLYSGANIFLKRKFDKFDTVFCLA